MFKKGDKVKLRKPIYAGMRSFNRGVVNAMVEVTKKYDTFTVHNVLKDGSISIKEDKCLYLWDSKFFELVKANKIHELKVGDKIRIISAECGAYGAEGKIGIVTDKRSEHGIGFSVEDFVELSVLVNSGKDFKVEFKDETIWNIGRDIEFELLEKAKPRKEIKEINIIIKGDETIAVIDDKLGEAKRNKSDAIDDRIGIIIATMRALRFKKEEVEGVIDVLFDDLPKTKELKDYSNKELMKELNKRL